MQTEAACKMIEQMLGMAYERMARQHRRHTKLFLAYVALNRDTDERDRD